MTNSALNKPLGVTVIAVLALAQAVFGVLRAFGWFEIGSDLLGRGLLILPLIGVVAYARGLLVVSVVVQGESFARAILWALVPVITVGYLITPAGREALGINSDPK